MPRSLRTRAVLAALLGAAAVGRPARVAAEAPAPAGRFELALGLSGVEYAEYGASGIVLDGEDGALPAVSAAVELRRGALLLGVVVSHAAGDLGYDGRVQSADPALDDLPVRTSSRARFVSAEAQVGRSLPAAPRFTVFAGATRRTWERDIEGTQVMSRAGELRAVQGLSEAYLWYEVLAGLRLAVVDGPAVEWDLEARVMRTVRSRVAVEWFGDDVALRLPARTGYRLGTALRAAAGPAAFVAASAWFEQYGFGASGVDRVHLIHEPESETRGAGFAVGGGARF